MQEQLMEAWRQVQTSMSAGQTTNAAKLAMFLLTGGLLALFIKWLYQRFGKSMSSRDSVTRVFPLLTLVTIGVITVVKTSLALSLGLVGALSIVRFRAAIKEPEELVYLFLCIGVGLALGAEQPAIAGVLVIAATVFIVGTSWMDHGRDQETIMLTITGDSIRKFSNGNDSISETLTQIIGNFQLQRFDAENGRGQIRVVFKGKKTGELPTVLARLQTALPDCEISMINLNSTI
jgi:hypothetical protein